jgi:MYXO-CTERM domain-containing protein
MGLPWLFLLPVTVAGATEGFHKDLFMDSGCDLSQRERLYAAEFLGLSYDAMVTEDEDVQYEVIVSSEDDWNGSLLYPDGAPRYRLIYTNGGSATGHGRSLGEEGRQRVRDFYAGGGSYTGSCAGAFISMLHFDQDDFDENGAHEPYYHLWPGVGDATYTGAEVHDIVFEDVEHPLVAMYASLADGRVEDVYHNYGCRFDPEVPGNPAQTEYLGVNEYGTSSLDGYYNIMAYKDDEETGRVVVTCSHPEGRSEGEQLELTAAILRYALEGLGDPWPAKGALDNGVPVEMTDADERIGDGQYHAWSVELPEGVATAEFRLDGLSDDCDLYASLDSRPDRLAYDAVSSTPGTAAEAILLTEPEPGPWVVAVYGAHERLNGSAYRVSASWEREEDDVPGGYRIPEDEGCGCATGSGAGLSLVVAVAVLPWRRRRTRPAA